MSNETHTPPVAPQPGLSRGWKLAFGLSVAMNLAVLGVIGGAMLRDGPPHRMDMVRDLGFGPFTEALSHEDRAAMRGAFLERAPDFKKSRADMRAEFAAVLAALRAEPFSVDGLTAALTAQSARAQQNLTMGQDLLAERVAAMSPAERTAFADRLEQSLTRRKSRGDGKP